MCAANVVRFAEPSAGMTIAEGLAYLERTRRQLDRFDTALPNDEGSSFDAAERSEIRTMCDALEADLNRLLGIA